MSKELACEIVRDLLPSYVDGQTSDVSNNAIEEHIEGCPDCAEVLRRMREPEKNMIPQIAEIDYLKKFKRSKRLAAWIAVAITLFICILLAGLRIFARGTESELNMHAADIEVDGNIVHFKGELVSSGEGVARVTFDENEGVVDIRLFTAPIMPFNRGSFNETYAAGAAVKAVTSGGLVIWENGELISHDAGMLYAVSHPYVGDMPANQRVANAIGIGERYGAYTNELQTAEEPYAWIINLSDPVDESNEERIRQRMEGDACLMFAAIGNLGVVTWRYDNGKGQQEYSVTRDDASEIAGADIKIFSESAYGLQMLFNIVR